MIDSRPVKRDMLTEPIDITTNGSTLTFDRAKRMADGRAREILASPMLLAWFDKKEWKHSPAIVCGCGKDVPSWVTYAQSRGARISVLINNGEYVFLYKEAQEW
jgi:hypothetical protein